MNITDISMFKYISHKFHQIIKNTIIQKKKRRKRIFANSSDIFSLSRVEAIAENRNSDFQYGTFQESFIFFGDCIYNCCEESDQCSSIIDLRICN